VTGHWCCGVEREREDEKRRERMREERKIEEKKTPWRIRLVLES
jgi:hypothetical protein